MVTFEYFLHVKLIFGTHLKVKSMGRNTAYGWIRPGRNNALLCIIGLNPDEHFHGFYGRLRPRHPRLPGNTELTQMGLGFRRFRQLPK